MAPRAGGGGQSPPANCPLSTASDNQIEVVAPRGGLSAQLSQHGVGRGGLFARTGRLLSDTMRWCPGAGLSLELRSGRGRPRAAALVSPLSLLRSVDNEIEFRLPRDRLLHSHPQCLGAGEGGPAPKLGSPLSRSARGQWGW